MNIEDVNIDELTPMMKDYVNTKLQYKDEILFYRLGDFYEMFFDDAKIVSKELDLVLTKRSCGMENLAPMAGIPHHAADSYISKLVKKGYKVAICEQIGEVNSGNLMRREVVKVITPGTVTDTNMLDDKSSNYILCVHLGKETCSVATADITTGTFLATELDLSFSKVLDEVSRFSPKEIIISNNIKEKDLNVLKNTANVNLNIEPEEYFLKDNKIKVVDFEIEDKDDENNQNKNNEQQDKYEEISLKNYNFIFENKRYEYNNDDYEKTTKVKQNNSEERAKNLLGEEMEDLSFEKNTSFETLTDEIQKAIIGLLRYIYETQKQKSKHINEIEIYKVNEYMSLDMTARKNLEINKRLQDGKKRGSLLWVLDKTDTSMGSRLLSRWINNPLLSKNEIVRRQDAVEEFFNNTILKGEVRAHLKKIYDIERISSKIAYGSVNARDLIALKNSIMYLPMLKLELKDTKSELLKHLYENLDILNDIYEMIESAIIEEPPMTITEGGIIKPEYDEKLYRLTHLGEKANNYLINLEVEEREKTDIRNLKIGYSRVFGYYIEVSKSNLDKVPDRYIRKQTLANAERYITEELQKIENELLTAKEKIISLEYEIFKNIRNTISKDIVRIQSSAKIVSAIDVLCSLATVAEENSYIKPEMSNNNVIDIENGRHPVVEKMIGKGEFVGNDTYMDSFQDTFLLITGPNMSGKSTYMRQVALIVLMAQIGSFVPADKAKIGLVDKIFTRIGASDDLGMGQSTFMVEMNEVANILENATEKSLILLDEVGRGTSTYDGISIARAVLEYIVDKTILGSRTLFATHYHELVSLEGKVDGMKNYHVDAKITGKDVVFLRKLKLGGTSDSYGIHVARLAGIPNPVLKKAEKILSNIEKKDILLEKVKEKEQQKVEGDQLGFSDFAFADIVQSIKGIDINNMSPMEAMKTLYDLKEKTEDL